MFISESPITEFTVIEPSATEEFGLAGQYHSVNTGMIGYEFTVFGLTLTGPIPENAEFAAYTQFEDPENPGMTEGFYCRVPFNSTAPYADLMTDV